MFKKIRAMGAAALMFVLATVFITLPSAAWFGGFGFRPFFGGFGGFGFGFPFFRGFGGFGFPFFNNFSFSSSLAFNSMFSGMGSFFF